MTWDERWGKAPVSKHVIRLLRCLIFLGISVTWGCGEPDELTQDSPKAPVEVRSVDGKLQVTLPSELIVHRHTTSIQATDPGGGLRYYVGYHRDKKLVSMIGTLKSIVTKHAWSVESEKHYAQASEMRLRRKRPGSDIQEQRAIWYVPASGGVVVCDGIAVESRGDLLGDPFKSLCTGIRMRDGASQQGQGSSQSSTTSGKKAAD